MDCYRPTFPQVDFDALRAINPDVVGWLVIDGTNINYPVVQGTDNQYYLRHLFTGEYNASGCIFLDSRNTRIFSDQHSILYGHHMGNGTMFNGLMDYKEQAFYDAHPSALLLTPAGNYEIKFFSGYVANVRADAWQVEFGSEGEFTDWLQAVEAKPYFPPLDGNVDCSRCENQSCMNRDKSQRSLRNFTCTSGRCPRLPDYRGIVAKSEQELYAAAFPLIYAMCVDGRLHLTLEVPGRKRSRKVYRTKSGYWYCREKDPNGCPAKRVITMEEAGTEQIIRARMDMVGTDFCLFRCTVEDYFM